MTRLRSLPPPSPLGLLGVGLVACGLAGPWLTFPLSEPLSVLGIGLSASGLGVLAPALLLAVFGGVLGELLGARTLTNAAAVLGAAVLALFFARVSAGDASGWLLQYMAESEQREALQAFLDRYYWPNQSDEPTTSLITDATYLVDRAWLTWHMTGWKVAQVIGTVVDVEFPPDQLPNLFDALDLDNGGENLVLEVQQHIGNNWVRCLALGSTDGLARGVAASATCG